jgi:hypothetical protein
VSAPWSRRFCFRAGGPGLSRYTVPAGQTAVVKSVLAYNSGAAAGVVSLLLNGNGIWAHSIQASDGFADGGWMVVLGPGEYIELYTGGTTMAGQVSGYLLDGVNLQGAPLPAPPPAGTVVPW